MSISHDEFADLINAEVIVDMDKLKQAARHGIPDKIRPHVWMYLLGVKTPDKVNEVSTTEAKSLEYNLFQKESSDTLKRVRAEAFRYAKSRLKTLKSPSSTLENVVSAYLYNNRHIDYSPSLIHLCGSFVYAFSFEKSEEYDIYYCFERFMSLLLEVDDWSRKVSRFLGLFRTIMPELFNHFEEEEIDFKEWSYSWLQYLLAKELNLDCVLRLWDTYFSIGDPSEIIELHQYICLAILDSQKEDLEESEQSQIHAHLLRLPYLDMDQIISRAMNLKSQFAAQS